MQGSVRGLLMPPKSSSYRMICSCLTGPAIGLRGVLAALACLSSCLRSAAAITALASASDRRSRRRGRPAVPGAERESATAQHASANWCVCELQLAASCGGSDCGSSNSRGAVCDTGAEPCAEHDALPAATSGIGTSVCSPAAGVCAASIARVWRAASLRIRCCSSFVSPFDGIAQPELESEATRGLQGLPPGASREAFAECRFVTPFHQACLGLLR